MVSPGCTVTLAGEKAWFGAISQNGRYVGTNVPPEGTQPSITPTCSTVVLETRNPSKPTQCPETVPLVAVTPVQLTAGTVKCAEIQRKVRVPWEAAYPAQLADCRPEIAWIDAAAAGGLPPTTLMGVPGWKWRSRAAAGLGLAAAAAGAAANATVPSATAPATVPTTTEAAREMLCMRFLTFMFNAGLGQRWR